MLTLNAITVRLGGVPILDGASAALPPRARIGLVGRNGAGKSTLVKVVAGLQEADGGSVEMPRGTRIGYLAQDAPGGDATPFDTVLAADTERAALLDEAERTQDAHRLGEIHERLATIGADAAPARAARVLRGLGFDEAAQHRALDTFSGGWRMRVALAALLFSEPDFLLLDEPSNHLDLEAEIWLEQFLRTYRGTLLVVSHERELLNHVVTHILHLEGGRLALYAGNYDAFERQRAERRAQEAAERAKQAARRAKLQAYIDRWRYKAHTARQAQSRVKALARMAPLAELRDDPSLTFGFPSPKALRPPLIVLEDVAVGYDGVPVLAHLSLRIDPDSRIALLGRNGNGKTTLARLLAGQLAPLAGSMVAPKVRAGYFAQHQIDELVPEETPFQHMARALPDAKPGELRGQLGRFGFSGDKALLAVRSLSGGERARLALALITREAPHLLILDEPSNHLDVDARAALVEALAEYEGAVVAVSHDRHFLELAADRLLLVADGTAREFDGSLDDYRDLVLRADRTDGEGRTAPRASRKDERRDAATARGRSQALRTALRDAEAEVAKLAARRNEIDRALFDPAAAAGTLKDKRVSDLMILRADTDRALAAAEERWLAASEALEQAQPARKSG